jgi:hypothetical protein
MRAYADAPGPRPRELPPPRRAPDSERGGTRLGRALALAEGGGGRPVSAPLRARVEEATGGTLEGVRLHADRRAAESAGMLGARAFTVGRDVYFGLGEYRPGSTDGDRLIAHELVHTLQPGAAAGPDLQSRGALSRHDDPAEREAEAAAGAIVAARGDALPRVAVREARRPVSRTEIKNGAATFKVDPYTELDTDNGKDTARQVGVHVELTYKSAPGYLSDKIAFIQTMKTTKDGSPYLFENEKPRATKASDGEAGWAIDRLKGKKSPIYGQNDAGTAASTTTFGYRKSATDAKDAWLRDRLALNRAVGQPVTVDAVSFAFDETNGKYLGGVSWGFATTAAGSTTKKAPALHSAGDPAGVQKQALVRWNEQAALADTSKRNAPDQATVVVP